MALFFGLVNIFYPKKELKMSIIGYYNSKRCKCFLKKVIIGDKKC